MMTNKYSARDKFTAKENDFVIISGPKKTAASTKASKEKATAKKTTKK